MNLSEIPRGVLIGVIVFLICAFITVKYINKPDIEIDINIVESANVRCWEFRNPSIEFTVANKGEPSNFFNYVYVRGKQINNTCGKNLTFFKDSKLMCHLDFLDDKNSLTCPSKSPPIAKGEHTNIGYIFSEETHNLIQQLIDMRVDSCELKEMISVCAVTPGKKPFCSDYKPISVKFMCDNY